MVLLDIYRPPVLSDANLYGNLENILSRISAKPKKRTLP